MVENSNEEYIENAEHFINSIKTDKEYKEENGWHGYYNKEIVELARILEHILQDYKRVLKENEEKNKIIDSMIKVMIDSSICDYFIKENCKNYAGENRKICDDCIKEYFENKVKEVK